MVAYRNVDRARIGASNNRRGASAKPSAESRGSDVKAPALRRLPFGALFYERSGCGTARAL